jgi:steroid delta-isomerase-like uncharacterized protein
MEERTMAEQDLIRLACENVEAYSVGNWQRLKALLAPDVVYHEVGSQRRLQGADQLIEAYQGWKQFAPNGMGTITKALTSGNSVALEVTWTGTHTGPLVGTGGTIPPSGKSWSLPGAQLITFQGDKIKELHQYFDMLTLLQQIGAAPK